MGAAAPFLVTAAASWVLGKAVSGLLSDEPDQPIHDDKPTTLSNRGDYIPLLIGRERMGPFFAYAGDRYVVTENTSSGGKGHTGGGVNQDVYFENGMHVICVGPGNAIHGLWRNGERILDFSTITPDTHPDGTTLEVFFEEQGDDYKMGDMTVYWGFQTSTLDGTVNEKTGIDSGYPGLLRVVWQNMRLGGFPQWPLVEYEVEVRPYREEYTSTNSWEDAAHTFGTGTDDWLTDLYGPNPNESDSLVLFENLGGTSGTIVHLAGNHQSTYAAIRSAGERVTISDSTEEPRVNGTYRIASTVSWNQDKIVNTVGIETDQNIPAISTWNLAQGAIADLPDQVLPDGSLGTVSALHGVIFEDSGGDFAATVRFVSTFKEIDPVAGKDFTYRMILRDTDNSVDHKATFHGNLSSGYTLDTTNGGSASIEALGYGWRRITYIYNAGEGSIPSDTLDDLQYKIDVDRSTTGNEIDICHVYDAADSVEAWHTPTTQIVGTTSFELDIFLPNIPTVPLVDGDMIPWQAGFGPTGPNPASVLHQLLFAPAPYGAELNEAWFKTQFDGTPSLSNFHTLRQLADSASIGGINAHVLIQRGDTYQSAVDNFLLDLGWMVSWDSAIARYVFTPLRDPHDASVSGNATIWEIPNSILTEGPPETITLLEDIGPNRISYTYKDRARRYKTDSVVLSADGQVEDEGIQRQDDSKLYVARDRSSAERIALRRGQLDISKPSTFNMNVGSTGKLLYPGNTFIFADAPDIDREDIFRVIEVTPSQTEGSAKITAAFDIYSLEETGSGVTDNLALSLGPDAGDGPTVGVEDLVSAIVELPTSVAGVGRSFSYLRIRANQQIRDTDLHVSRDDGSFVFLNRQTHVATGGELLEAWDSAAEGDVTDGPLIKPLGPDFARNVRTLDSFNFAAGRQVAIIGDEWFFLKEVSAEEYGTYRLTGFNGGRYGSTRASHAVGDCVFICEPATLPIYTDVLAAPGVAVYVKGAPRAQLRLPLTSATSINKTLTGVAGPGVGTIHSGDETDLDTTYPATGYSGGTVMLQDSVSGNWTQYYSDGTIWNLID